MPDIGLRTSIFPHLVITVRFCQESLLPCDFPVTFLLSQKGLMGPWLGEVLRFFLDDNVSRNVLHVFICLRGNLTVGNRNVNGGVDGDDDGFGGGRVALVRHAVDGDEHVGFGKVRRNAGAGNGVGDHDKV